MDTSLKWRFAATFLLTFAVLVVLWWTFDIAAHYRAAGLAVAQALSPSVSGWWLQYDPAAPANPVYRLANRELPMALDLAALSMGLMPFVSLVAATPGLRRGRRLFAVGAGCVLYFAIHVSVVLSYPLIMYRPILVKDTLGVFSGLVAFVVAPLALWFALTYPALRSVWHLSAPPADQ
jgi:hypothetical protein